MEKIIFYGHESPKVYDYLKEQKIKTVKLKIIREIGEEDGEVSIIEKKILATFNKYKEKSLEVDIEKLMYCNDGDLYECYYESIEYNKYEMLLNKISKSEYNISKIIENIFEINIWSVEAKDFFELSREKQVEIIDKLCEKEVKVWPLYGEMVVTEGDTEKKMQKKLKEQKDNIIEILKDKKPSSFNTEEEKEEYEILYLKKSITKKEKERKKEKDSEEKSNNFLEAVESIIGLKVGTIDKNLKDFFKQSDFRISLYYYAIFLIKLKDYCTIRYLKDSNANKYYNAKKNIGEKVYDKYLKETPEENRGEIKEAYSYYKKYKNKWELKVDNEQIEIFNLEINLKEIFTILNSTIDKVRVEIINKEEKLFIGNIYAVNYKKNNEKKQYIGCYNKVLSELCNNEYIFERKDIKESIIRLKKEEIISIGIVTEFIVGGNREERESSINSFF